MQEKLIQLSNKKIQHLSITFVIFSVVIFIFAIIGIFTRPLAYSAFFWPANPVFLGLLIRYPKMRNGGALLGAFSGYMLADLATGNGLALTFILTITNFISILPTFILFLFLRYKFKLLNDDPVIIYPYVFQLLVEHF